MSKKAWIIFAAAVIAGLIGLTYLAAKDKVDVSAVDVEKIQPASEQSGNIADHVFGKEDSKVVLIEYGDYQCPGCNSVYPTLKAISEKYEDQLAFVFRNFPLTSIHPNAKAAAAAAEAAGLQDKFWEMHDILYANQSSWKDSAASQRTDVFASYANNLGLDVEKFKADLANQDVTRKINFDLAIGKKANVTATPTIFLNGKQIEQDTWHDAKKLDTAVADELKKHGIELPKEDEKDKDDK